MRSALYAGVVVHERLRPRRHRLKYRVFSLLLDIDELPALDRQLRLFGHNRAALLSFHDRDHGEGIRDGLRQWVEARLQEAGIPTTGSRIEVLCYPRMFGYVFNPITVYYCREPGDRLVAILYEVNNTHAEWHTYVIPVTDDGTGVVRQICDKAMFVSPFVAMDCTYSFRMSVPGDKVAVSIVETDGDGPLLSAAFTGHRRTLTDGALIMALLAYPLMTLKVVAAIHFEALRLWLKGVPVVHRKPAARRVDATIVGR